MRRFSLVLVFLAGAMMLPQLLAAEDILTICGCPPNTCPSGAGSREPDGSSFPR